MLTKLQKRQVIEDVVKDLEKTKTLCFVNFSNVSLKDLTQLRGLMKSLGSRLRVIKKRLLKLALEKKGIQFDPTQFGDQVGTLFISNEIFDVAGPIHKLFKMFKRAPEILGVYEVEKKNFLASAQFKIIAQIPSRETLLTQLVYILGSPIRSFMLVLEGRAKKIST